jgi:hypothetical protein
VDFHVLFEIWLAVERFIAQVTAELCFCVYFSTMLDQQRPLFKLYITTLARIVVLSGFVGLVMARKGERIEESFIADLAFVWIATRMIFDFVSL